jgi:tripartite-type tricarboxylate transporter receptor subunit TctC
MKQFSRRAAALLAGLALAGGIAPSAMAQTFPARPITLVVPFAAGGPTDIIARAIAERMTETLGQNVIVENVAGAAGTTGALRVARADKDGHMLLMGPMSTMTFSPSLYPNVGFEPQRDLDPVGIVASAPIMLVASTKIPVKSIADLRAHAATPGVQLNNGNAGVGSTSHLACLLLNRELKINATMVPYRGTGPAIQDLVGGQVQYICDQVTSLMGQVQAGTITPVAMMAPTRSPVLPDVPTAAEAGVPGVDMLVWNAIFAPKGTPREVVMKLNEAIGKGLESPAARDRFRALGAEAPTPDMRSPEALARMHAADLAKWGALIKAADVRVTQ